MKYTYTNAEWQRTIEAVGVQYFNEGDVIETFNNLTGKTVTYVIEVKKVATQTSKDWTKTPKH